MNPAPPVTSSRRQLITRAFGRPNARRTGASNCSEPIDATARTVDELSIAPPNLLQLLSLFVKTTRMEVGGSWVLREASPDADGDAVAALMVEYLTWALDRLIEEARAMNARVLRLDTCRFMTDAQRLYESRGFVERPPYEGTEIPPELQQYWKFYERQEDPQSA